MFKIEILCDDGREPKMQKDNFIYYKGLDGADSFWEGEHIAPRADEFEPIFAQAKTLIDKAEKRLPNTLMSGLR